MARKRTPPPASEPTSNLVGLVQACKDEPDDDGLRGILADYLEDHGEPERAELIRLGIQADRPRLARAGAARVLARLARLQRVHAPRWLGTLPIPHLRPTFRRGFLSLHLEMSDLRKKAVAHWLASLAPWPDRLRLHYGQQSQVTSLAEHPGLTHFTALELTGPALDREHVRELAYGTHVAGLRELKLSLKEHLVGSSRPLYEKEAHLPHLRSLALTGRLSADMLEQLGQAPFAPQLRSLEISSQPIHDQGARVLGDARSLTQLRSLSLRWINLGNQGLAPFLEPAAFPQLRELHLESIKLGGAKVAALAAQPSLARIESLTLDHCEVSDEGVLALANSPHVHNLRRLSLVGGGISPSGARALAGSRNLPRLEILNLSDNPNLGESGAAALFSLDRLSSLKDLELAYTRIPERSLDRLVSGPLAPRLRRLRLAFNLIGPEGAAKLARAESLRSLEALELDVCDLGNAGLTALARSGTLERLTWLTLSADESLVEGITALAAGEGLPSLVFLNFLPDNGDHLGASMARALSTSPRRADLFFVEALHTGNHPELVGMQNPYWDSE